LTKSATDHRRLQRALGQKLITMMITKSWSHWTQHALTEI